MLLMRDSSVAEHLAHNQAVAGSSPAPATIRRLLAQLVEHRLDKAVVVGSTPTGPTNTRVAQLVERLPYKQDVGGSIPPLGTSANGLASGHQPSKLARRVRLPLGAPLQGRGRVAQRSEHSPYKRAVGEFESPLDYQSPIPLAAAPHSGLLNLGSQFDSEQGFQSLRRCVPRAAEPQQGPLNPASRFDSGSGYHRLCAGNSTVECRPFKADVQGSSPCRRTSRQSKQLLTKLDSKSLVMLHSVYEYSSVLRMQEEEASSAVPQEQEQERRSSEQVQEVPEGIRLPVLSEAQGEVLGIQPAAPKGDQGLPGPSQVLLLMPELPGRPYCNSGVSPSRPQEEGHLRRTCSGSRVVVGESEEGSREVQHPVRELSQEAALQKEGLVAQLAEQGALNAEVRGSIPREPTIFGSVVQLAGCRSPKPVISVQIGADPPVERLWCVHGAVGSARACQVRGRGFKPRCTLHAGVAQSAEHILGTDEVGGSIPLPSSNAPVAQSVEHLIRNQEAGGSIPPRSSSWCPSEGPLPCNEGVAGSTPATSSSRWGCSSTGEPPACTRQTQVRFLSSPPFVWAGSSDGSSAWLKTRRKWFDSTLAHHLLWSSSVGRAPGC